MVVWAQAVVGRGRDEERGEEGKVVRAQPMVEKGRGREGKR